MNNLYFIYLSNTKGYCVIDAEDSAKCNSHSCNWTITEKGYIRTRSSIFKEEKNPTHGLFIFIHRLVLDKCYSDFELVTDHINRFKWDNRKCNLRIVECGFNRVNTLKSENCTSKYKGVSYARDRKKWRAKVSKIVAGYFKTEIEAAIEANKLYSKFYGDSAILNTI